MPVPLQQIAFSAFGGGNWADERLSLIARSHVLRDGSWKQVAPVEAGDLRNVDFDQRSLIKRLGSAEIDDSSSVHAASESILGGFAVGGNQFLVGKKSLYRKASGGSWARMQASGGGDFSHDSDVTKWTVAFGDGYAFVGTDGTNNEIQVVDPSSVNLKPEMKNANSYTEQKGGGSQTITGTWPTAAYIVVWFQNRLCMSTGDSVLEFTDVNEPWDLTGGGFWQFKADLVAAKTFIPRGQNELLERLFGFTAAGLQILSGFDASDSPFNMEGGGIPVSARCVAASQDWLIYPTEQQTVEAVNLLRFIDLGRRGRHGDGSTGPLDNFDPSNSNHAALTFAFFDRKQKQWSVWFPDGASRSTVSMAFAVDMQGGEPGLDEGQNTFENHTRPLWWTIKEPAANAWFVDLYQNGDTVVGVLASGKTYTYGSGDNDLDTLAVESYWDEPDFDGGDPSRIKNFRRFAPLFDEVGDHNVEVQPYLDLSPNPTGSPVNFSQVNAGTTLWGQSTWGGGQWGGAGVVQNTSWLELYARTLRLRISNSNTDEPWRLAAATLSFQQGTQQD